MKAISMPINIVVVLLLAVLVMAALIIWFMGTVPPTAQQTSWQTVLRNCCVKWVSLGCDDQIKSSVLCSVPAGLVGNKCKPGQNTCNINNVASDAGIGIDDIKKFCGC